LFDFCIGKPAQAVKRQLPFERERLLVGQIYIWIGNRVTWLGDLLRRLGFFWESKVP